MLVSFFLSQARVTLIVGAVYDRRLAQSTLVVHLSVFLLALRVIHRLKFGHLLIFMHASKQRLSNKLTALTK